MTDKEYIRGITNNDSAIIAKFYSEHKGLVKKLIYDKDSHNYVEFDDLYSEVMYVVITKIQLFELTADSLSSKLSTYIYRVAHNKLIDIIRKKKKEIDAAGDIREALTIQLMGEGDYIDFDETFKLLKSLNPPCYELLMDRYIHNVDYNDLADKYNYSNYNSVKKKKGKCIEHAKQLVMSNFERLTSDLG